jgi:Mg-chelatase subunit ChlD
VRCPICRTRIDTAIHIHDAGVPSEVQTVPAVTQPLPPPPALLARAASVSVAPDPVTAGRRPVAISVATTSAGEQAAVVRLSSPDDAATRLGADIVVAIDVSGSMGEDATYEDASGAVRTDGLSVLDIARHGIRVVAALLKGGDRLGVVTFNKSARVVLPLSAMDDAGRAAAGAAVDAMRPDGGTNIWGGLEAAMDLLRCGSDDAARAGREQSVLLLTDGVPNVDPPAVAGVLSRNSAAAHVAAYTAYASAHPGFHCTVRTFGFGYKLDSELLLAVARAGGGTFAFIPVAPVMGTTFVHAVANT